MNNIVYNYVFTLEVSMGIIITHLHVYSDGNLPPPTSPPPANSR